jgi:hypothetical protein
MKIIPKNAKSSGFALVVSLTLMILLTVIAVGLLTLSSISLRSASQGEAMAKARSNARLALLLAIGELQKTTGQDRAITAPASIVDPKHPMGVTGVWTPWLAGSAGDSRTKTARNDNFRQWLVSTVDGKPSATRTAPPLAALGAKDSVTLLGDGSLGSRASEKSDDQRINLATTPVTTGGAPSRLAWAVIDESTKARVDLYERDATSVGAAVMRAGAPPVDGVAALSGLDALTPDESQAERMITMSNAGLVLGAAKDKLKVYSPDLTVDAVSLLTDVVSGGLKKDLSLWFSKGLTTLEGRSGLYQASGAIQENYPADPPMSLLQAYHDYYKNIGKRVGSLIPPADGVVAKLPSRYTAMDLLSGIASPNVPVEPLMVPTILRVDIVFSLITRDVHGNRAARLRSAGRPYLMHLLYLPVVTIHNPYNRPMSFEGLKVTFKNVPIAFQFLVDGQALTTNLVPLNQLYSRSEGNSGSTKDFSCTLGSAISGSSSPPIVLEAGQTKLFGTPKVLPTWRWQDESPGAGADGIALFDWRNNQTSDFKIAPKLMTPPTIGAGFDCDWLAPRQMQTAMGIACGQGDGIVSLKGGESLGVRYAPFAPSAGKGSFDVKVELVQRGRFYEAGAFSIKYGDAGRLTTIVEQGTSLRFPDQRSFPETYPKPSVDPEVTAGSLYETNGAAIKDYIAPKPFVIFSVGSRTTKESFVATRTVADGNPVTNLANVDLSNGKDPVGGVPLEMVMMPIRNGNAAIEDLRDTEEGYAFGGNGSQNGTTRATFYELPGAPLQSVAQFRHANLAGSGFMPMMTYTAGESRAHPQIGTNTIKGAWTDNSVMLDHTWLANEALWDRYFLSTIADQTTVQFPSDKSYEDVMSDFFAGKSRLPNQRLIPYSGGASGPLAAIQSSTTPQDEIAASLQVQGGFNVNSTSEDAWIAVLSGLRNADVETAAGLDPGVEGRSALPRVRRPTGKNIDSQAIHIREQRWEGYRSLSDSEIALLAKEIVKEVRSRGPFLSLADFVNRGIGADTDEVNLKGAIQAAIDRTSVNEEADFDGIDLTSAPAGIYGYESERASSGNTATDSPGCLTQGDILTAIGSRTTVRADTFRIRAYGEARDASGNTVLAKAWCEAIVQRVPDYVDPAEAATVKQVPLADGASGTVNQLFGRRYEVRSFRWLSPEEV